jgi:hypothetical protein
MHIRELKQDEGSHERLPWRAYPRDRRRSPLAEPHAISAEELPELNRNIVGLIEVIASFERA